jgi:putative transposase
VTIVTAGRRAILASEAALAVPRTDFEGGPSRYGWTIGRYVVMPDPLHFFTTSNETPGAASLSRFMAGFKLWTAKCFLGSAGAAAPLWRKEFFDHVLRSNESYESKWNYVRENPVRAGLVNRPDDWPYSGEIAIIMR